MTHLLLGAVSGWGKSLNAQSWMEENLPEFDYGAILDFKDEYRGLVKEGFANWVAVDERLAALSREGWMKLFRDQKKLVLARAVDTETWRQVADKVAYAMRNLDGSALLANDEAHFTASQRKGTPEELASVATTGRGEGVSSIHITQRLQKLDEDVLSQCNEKILGGFTSDRDREKMQVEYPEELHNAERNSPLSPNRVPDELLANGDGLPLRRWTDDNDQTVGSEWIYSNDRGDRQRLDTSGLPETMQTTHYGPEGNHLTMPDYA